MKKLTITNSDNTKMNVDLVRYFKFKTDCFLIYSIGEIDEKNYMKLYLVRIMEELGFPVVQTIKNDADWANMQGIVKKVLKELKKGKKKLTEDLDYKEIEGIKVVDPRFFKLDSKLVDLLASNYMDENTVKMSEFSETQIESLSLDDGENETSDIELEPIDQTMMKQSIEVPSANITTDNFSNNTSPVDKNQISEIVSNVEDKMVKDNTTIDLKTLQSTEANDNNSVDYKKLYDAMKADNDATNELLNAVMTELNKYKEKYGELVVD